MRIHICSLLLLLLSTVCTFSEHTNVNCADFVNLNSLESQLYSQFGEDGILLGLIDLLNRHSTHEDGSSAATFAEYYVEFGVESGVQCNSRVLREELGYTGLMMDGGYSNQSIGLQQEFVTEGNILQLFAKYDVPLNLDVLSVDVDMFDYWILARILSQSQYRPRIIIVETNPTLCVNNYLTEYRSMNKVPLSVIHPDHTNQTIWDGTRYSGANSEAFRVLGKRYGYDLVHCERCGVNCFLVRRDAIPTSCRFLTARYSPMVPYPCFSTLNPQEPGGTMIGHPFDPQQRAAVMVDEKVVDILSNTHSRVTFKGQDHIDPQKHGWACSSGGGSVQGWGGNICSQLYVLHATGKNTDSEKLYRAHRRFVDSDFEGAASLFQSLLFPSGDDKSDKAGCRSQHLSEAACLCEYKLLFNTALCHFNTAATAAVSSNGDEKVVTVLQSAIELLLKATAMKGDTVGEHTRVASLLSFMSFLLPSIADPHAFVRQLLEKEVSLPLSMSSRDGSDESNTNIIITVCDDTALISSRFCQQHSINTDSKSCEKVRQGLESEARRALFPSPTAFDWAALMRGTTEEESGQVFFRGFTALPVCYEQFEAVRLLRGSCVRKEGKMKDELQTVVL